MTKLKINDRVTLIDNSGSYKEHANGTNGTVHAYGSTRQFIDVMMDTGKMAYGAMVGRFVPEVVQPVHAPVAHPQTKIDRLKNHLLGGRSITQLEAMGLYSLFRLAARIHELKEQGWKISTTMKEDPTGNPYAEYALRTDRKVGR